MATLAPERVEVLRPESHLTRLRREAWALGDQALVSGMNFMTNVLLARLLGMKEFGIFTLAWMAVLFFNSLQKEDYPVLLAYSLMVGILTVLGNLAADLALAAADPRIRLA